MTPEERIFRLWDKHPYGMTLSDYYALVEAFQEYKLQRIRRTIRTSESGG